MKIIYKQSDDPKAPLRHVSLYLWNLGNKQHLSCFTMLKMLSKVSKIVIKFCTFPHILKVIIRFPPDSLSSAVLKMFEVTHV